MNPPLPHTRTSPSSCAYLAGVLDYSTKFCCFVGRGVYQEGLSAQEEEEEVGRLGENTEVENHLEVQ